VPESLFARKAAAETRWLCATDAGLSRCVAPGASYDVLRGRHELECRLFGLRCRCVGPAETWVGRGRILPSRASRLASQLGAVGDVSCLDRVSPLPSMCRMAWPLANRFCGQSRTQALSRADMDPPLRIGR